jgi:hypothetical protein
LLVAIRECNVYLSNRVSGREVEWRAQCRSAINVPRTSNRADALRFRHHPPPDFIKSSNRRIGAFDFLPIPRPHPPSSPTSRPCPLINSSCFCGPDMVSPDLPLLLLPLADLRTQTLSNPYTLPAPGGLINIEKGRGVASSYVPLLLFANAHRPPYHPLTTSTKVPTIPAPI